MKVVTFGEIMLRLEPEGYFRFVQVDKMTSTFGGGEANVAVSLANYGLDAYYVTKLPKHEIGQAAINSLRRFGVNTEYIVRGGDRVGIYYNERGASQRGSKCIYDRAHSSIAEAKPEDFNWTEIFKDCKWFHLTGITPALGGNMVQICIEACKAAKAAGATVSCDLNYRGKLWTREQAREAMTEIFKDCKWFHLTGITPALGGNLVQICIEACKAAKAAGATVSCDLNYRGKLWTREQAREAMTQICQYVDVCISNEEDAKDVFGIEAENTDITGGKLNKEGYKSVAKQLADKFGFQKVAITLRTSINANRNNWAALLYDGKDYCFSKEYEMYIVDRVGGGDSFGGGLIYSLLNGKSTQDAVEFAVAASCLKHTIEGDYNMVSVDEVEKLAAGNGSGRIQR